MYLQIIKRDQFQIYIYRMKVAELYFKMEIFEIAKEQKKNAF